MTTYAFQLSLNDSEVMAVDAALKHYKEFCEAQMAEGPKAPYWAHNAAIDSVMGRLYSQGEMTSTSSFCWPEKK